MEDWVSKIVEDERRKRDVPLEAKVLYGNYYLYRSTFRYDRTSRRTIKVSEYIRRITRDGVIKKAGILDSYTNMAIPLWCIHCPAI